MTIIYRMQDDNPVATKFTPEEAAISMEAESLQRLIDLGDAARRELDDIRHRCTHQVFTFERGEPYNWKDCAMCGLGKLA